MADTRNWHSSEHWHFYFSGDRTEIPEILAEGSEYSCQELLSPLPRIHEPALETGFPSLSFSVPTFLKVSVGLLLF
ncbi:hypothetical protein [uncultured Nostoc sp.]|uniref:hypothetical protein n=1 Tax=uncultured Nostoc sp. TaxID=340711 RepID=UPI0035CAFA10